MPSAAGVVIEKRWGRLFGGFPLPDEYIWVVPALPTAWFLYFFWSWLPSLATYCYFILPLQLCGAVFTYFRVAKYVVNSTHRKATRSFDEPIAAVKPTEEPLKLSGDGTVEERRRLRRRLSAFERVGKKQELNPFVNKSWKIDEAERRRISVAAVTLFPMRLIGIVLSLCWCAFWAKLALAGLSEEEKQKPLPEWRQWIVSPCKLGARSILFFAGYYWIAMKGRPATRLEAPVVVANHVSFVDPVFMCSQFLPSPVGAAEHLKAPLIGTIVRGLQTICVDRRSPTSRHDTLDAIRKRATEPGWPQIVLFPEGTTTNSSALITFKRGAFVAGVPVQPVCVRFPAANERGFDPAWVAAGPSPLNLVMRLLCEPVNRMEVEFLDPYCPSAEERQDAQLFAHNVRAVMAKTLGVPTTEHSYADVRLRQQAIKEHLPPDMPFVEVSTMKNVLHLDDVKSIAKMLKKFSSIDKSGTGKVNLAQFREAFGLEDSPEIDNLFHLLDNDETGLIDFREFMIGLGLVGESHSDAEVIKFAFKVFDLDGKGVNVANLKRMFSRAFPQLSDRDIESAFDTIDTNNDGRIDFDAFQRFAQSDPTYVTLFKKHILLADDDEDADAD